MSRQSILDKLKALLSWGWRNKIKIIVYSFLGGTALVIVLFTTGFFYWLNAKDSVVANLKRFQAEVTDSRLAAKIKPIEIYDINNKVIGTFYRRSLRPIRVDNIENHANIVWAVLSSEDREFYNHFGINITAIMRAILRNVVNLGVVQGGSTLTQQLAKVSLDLGGRNIFNKIVELYCTFHIESNYEKKTILAMYLNQIYMGHSNTGMEDASRFYFRKSAADLTAAEAAMLAGVIQAPSVYNPVRNLKIALKKQKIILGAMATNPQLHPLKELVSKSFKKRIKGKIKEFKERTNQA